MNRQVYDQCATHDRERINSLFANYSTTALIPPCNSKDIKEESLLMKAPSTKEHGRVNLCTRPFHAAPGLARGMLFPDVESELLQGSLQPCSVGDRPNVTFDMSVMPLNKCFRKFLIQGARTTVPWDGLIGQSARTLATQHCDTCSRKR